MTRLAWLINRYGEALEGDLRFYFGVRLLDFFKGEMTARELLVYIDRLPSDSAYSEAMAQDDEVVELLAQQPEGGAGPRLTEFGPQVQLLTNVVEALQELIGAVAWLGGEKPPKVSPLPRPMTARDRLTARVEEASHDYILEQIEEARRAVEAGGDDA